MGAETRLAQRCFPSCTTGCLWEVPELAQKEQEPSLSVWPLACGPTAFRRRGSVPNYHGQVEHSPLFALPSFYLKTPHPHPRPSF